MSKQTDQAARLVTLVIVGGALAVIAAFLAGAL